MAKKVKDGEDQGTGITIKIDPLQRHRVDVWIIGTSPIICNRMSEKAQRELLFPRGRMNQAQKAVNLKHDPIAEFRDAPYVDPDPSGPTYLQHLCTAVKKGMMTAALELPSTKKAQIGRLLRVERERFPLYGVPEMLMSVTRSSDMARTPDIRSRVIIREWAAQITLSFPVPSLNQAGVYNLLSAAGEIAGIGDWRQEKGAGSYGAYRIASEGEDALLRVMQAGRDVQERAMAKPSFYDRESAELFAWFAGESDRRGGFSITKPEV